MAAKERALSGVGHLLGADGEHDLLAAGGDRLPGEMECRSGRRAGVLHVNDREPAKTERPEQELPG